MPDASGTFTVTMTPAGAADAAIGRMLLDKTYAGDLEATATGEMLAIRSPVAGSAGYVAMEQISGTLHGRSGSFACQHSGTMDRGTPTLAITIVPDSGTGELAGIRGTLGIEIADGVHRYTIRYTLAD